MEDDGDSVIVPPAWAWRGIEFYPNPVVSCLLWRRWRFLWHNPRYRENWRIDGIFDEGVFQVGIGPAVFVYIRSDTY